MIKLEDLKVGDYVGCLWSNYVGIVKKINKKSFTTSRRLTIYESEFKDWVVITEEEVRARVIYNYNKELKELNKHLKELQENLNTISLNNRYYTIDTEAVDNKINEILENIKEELKNDN